MGAPQCNLSQPLLLWQCWPEHLQRSLTGCLGPLDHIGQYDHLVGQDVHKAAVNGEVVLLLAGPCAQFPFFQLGDHTVVCCSVLLMGTTVE